MRRFIVCTHAEIMLKLNFDMSSALKSIAFLFTDSNTQQYAPALVNFEHSINNFLVKNKYNDKISCTVIEEEAVLHVDVINDNGKWETVIQVKEISIHPLKQSADAAEYEE